MDIYPAIDLKGGGCVRLTQGVETEEKVYHQNPTEVALMWQQQGGRFLHIVDLDGAFKGEGKNTLAIKEILDTVDIPLQVGGGIRNLETIAAWLQMGVERVILGTKAVEDKEMLKRAITAFPNRVVVSIDVKEGYVTTEGWVKTSKVKALDFIRDLEAIGAKTIIYTDISRDGMLQGPNLEEIKKIKGVTTLEVIASGGVATLEDLLALKEIGVEGVIIGKALYEGRFSLKEAEVMIK